MQKCFKSLILAIVFLAILVIPVMADIVVDPTAQLCPFNPSLSTLTPGHFVVSKQIAGSTDGTMIASESIQNTNLLVTNSYEFSALSSGNTQYASSQAIDANSIGIIKAVQQSASDGGQALVQEQYFQGSRNMTGLSWCDNAAGGTLGSILTGTIASQTQLNRPVDLSYSVAYGSVTGNGTANGYGSIWSTVNSLEGQNSTLLAQQSASQRVQFTGNFQFAEAYSVHINHPWSPDYATLVTAVKNKGGC